MAGQIYIYFAIFHLSRMVIIEIGFWFFLLDRFTPFKLIKMFKCAKCVFFKMLYSPFQKRFCQIEQKNVNGYLRESRLFYMSMKQALYSFESWYWKAPQTAMWLKKLLKSSGSHKWLFFLIPNPKTNHCYWIVGVLRGVRIYSTSCKRN